VGGLFIEKSIDGWWLISEMNMAQKSGHSIFCSSNAKKGGVLVYWWYMDCNNLNNQQTMKLNLKDGVFKKFEMRETS
jgi:hypothetical protein